MLAQWLATQQLVARGRRSSGVHLLEEGVVQTTWTVIAQGAQGLRDTDLLEVAQRANDQTSRQLTWLTTRMKQAAPQALIVAP